MIAFQTGLKTVLGRSWRDLGPVLRSKILQFYWFFYYFVEIDVFEKKSSQDASWPDLGPIWVAKGGPRGGLSEAKLGWKRVRKSKAKKGLVLGGLGGGLPPLVAGSL